MTSALLNSFLQVLLTPYGLLGAAMLPVVLTNRSRLLPWLLFSLCCFTASLGKFELPFYGAPALVFPLEQIRALGRPLTIVLLGILSLLTLKANRQDNLRTIPKSLLYWGLVQVVVLIKTALQGDWTFALLNAATLGAVFFVTVNGFTAWLHDEKDFYLAVWSLAISGVIFIVANSYQAAQNLYPLMYIGGRFSGTTNNPNMAALVLASSIPSFLFFIEDRRTRSWLKLLCLLVLIVAMVFLFLTGSRTGVILAFIAVFIFYRQRLWFLIRLALSAGVLFLLLQPLLPTNSVNLMIVQPDMLWERYRFGSDTRSQIWLNLLNDFLNNPFFGKPFQGDRLSVGESSWLTVAAMLGIIGLTPMLMFGVEYLKTLLQLYRLSLHETKQSVAYSLVFSTLFSLLVGSFVEAFLLGTLTFPLFTLLLYISLAHHLIKVSENRTSIMLTEIPLSKTSSRGFPKTVTSL